MSKYSTLKAEIIASIKRNGAQAITGDLLQEKLLSMIDSLGEHYQFGGLASPSAEFTPGDEPVVFVAATPGTYTNFGGLVVADGEVALLVWSGSAWSKQTTDIATRTEVSQLGQKISGIKVTADDNNYKAYQYPLTAGRYFVRVINASTTRSVGLFFYTALDVELPVFVQAPAGGNKEAYIELPQNAAYFKTAFVGTKVEILDLNSLIAGLVGENTESIKKLSGIKITANTDNYDRYDCNLKAGRYFVKCINASQSSSVGIFFYTAQDVELSVFVQALAGGSAESYIDLPVDCAYIKTAFIGTVAEILYLDSAIGDIVARNAVNIDRLINPIEQEPTTIVVKDGGIIGTDCDFTDIDSALASISDNNKNNKYIVYIKNGVYDITGINYLGLKDYVTICGENRDGVIVKNSSVSYNANVVCFDPAKYGSNIIEYARIENLTLYIKNGKCCVHIDSDAIKDGGKIEIDNCRFINELEEQYIAYGRGGVNCGLNGGQTVEISNCFGNALVYAHTRINPQTENNANYFIVKNCHVNSVGFYDISDKVSNHKKNQLIVDNCKCDYIGIGVSELANDKAHCSIEYIINNNNNFNWVYIFGDGYVNGYDDWFTKYPICSAIHQVVRNLTGSTILKGTFVSVDVDGCENLLRSYDYNVTPYDGKLVFGYTLEDIADGDTGIIQVKGKVFIQDNNYSKRDFITLDSNGNPIIGTKENAIGVVTNIDQDNRVIIRLLFDNN